MASYIGLNHALAQASSYAQIERILIREWLNEYDRNTPDNDVVSVANGNFTYLFDIENERLIAAWGVSRGKHTGKRDSSRQAQSPLSAGKVHDKEGKVIKVVANYHRGHAIPHTLGGQMDINLVPQLASINIGPFRQLEREAVATPGSLYFTYWKYGRRKETDLPLGVEQGLLVLGAPPKIARHAN